MYLVDLVPVSEDEGDGGLDIAQFQGRVARDDLLGECTGVERLENALESHPRRPGPYNARVVGPQGASKGGCCQPHRSTSN